MVALPTAPLKDYYAIASTIYQWEVDNSTDERESPQEA